MSDISAAPYNPILDVTNVFGLVGAITLVGGIGYMIRALIEAWVMRGMPNAVLTYRETPPEQVRALIVLPFNSILVAVVSGAGINIATGGRGGEILQFGLIAVALAIFFTLYMGYLFVFNPPSVQHPARRLQLRLFRLREALDDDPFVSVERALQLLPELNRHVETGRRLKARPEALTFKKWFHQQFNGESFVLLVSAYVLAFSWIINWISRVVSTHVSVGIAAAGWTFTAFGVAAAVLGPAFGYFNYKKRCTIFGTYLLVQGTSLVNKVHRLDRMFGHRPPAPARPRKLPRAGRDRGQARLTRAARDRSQRCG